MNRWNGFLLTFVAIIILASVAAIALIHRGFRATTEPSSIERLIARSVRNLAIPSSARNETNPLQPSPEILQEARDHFIARCAVCHGDDGSGVTQMGRNLYPRVPNLRSPLTQN